MVAGFLFLVFWAVRFVQGKVNLTPKAPSLLDPAPAEEPAAPVIAGVGGESPYDPPQAPPPPLPPALPEAAGSGITRYFKVPIAHYRLLDLPLIGLVFLIYFALPAGSGGGPDGEPVEKKFTPELLMASIFFQLLLMGMACCFVVRRVKQSEWLGLRWKRWPLAFAIAPAAVFSIWIVLFICYITGWNAWLETTLGIEPMQESVKLLQEAQDPLLVILMSVAAVIVAPLAEEVVFRGYLYPAAKRFCGPLGAMLFSSLVFAAAHGNVVALLPLFILAMLLCLIYELTGSIWATISVHFLFNAATVTLQLLYRYKVLELPPPN